MERPLTITAVEDAIVRHCAAVLLNARPASMFTFVGDFASPRADDPVPADCALQGEKRHVPAHDLAPCGAPAEHMRRNRTPMRDPSPTAAQRARRARLTQLLRRCEQQLASDGIRIRVLTWRPCGAIVYVYRPRYLARSVSDPRVTRALAQMGYRIAGGDRSADAADAGARGGGASDADAPDTSKRGANAPNAGARGANAPAAGTQNAGRPERGVGAGARAQAEAEPQPEAFLAHTEARLNALLDQLGARFSCATGLPHEIGFFLGYPYEDVMGFIEHRGRNFICFGCWKVYANPRRALRIFSRFKRCARRAERLRRNGATLADLARPAAHGRALPR